MNNTNNFIPPLPGSEVSVMCRFCHYVGRGIIGHSIFGKTRIRNNRCPKCGKRGLVLSPFVRY